MRLSDLILQSPIVNAMLRSGRFTVVELPGLTNLIILIFRVEISDSRAVEQRPDRAMLLQEGSSTAADHQVLSVRPTRLVYRSGTEGSRRYTAMEEIRKAFFSSSVFEWRHNSRLYDSEKIREGIKAFSIDGKLRPLSIKFRKPKRTTLSDGTNSKYRTVVVWNGRMRIIRKVKNANTGGSLDKSKWNSLAASLLSLQNE